MQFLILKPDTLDEGDVILGSNGFDGHRRAATLFRTNSARVISTPVDVSWKFRLRPVSFSAVTFTRFPAIHGRFRQGARVRPRRADSWLYTRFHSAYHVVKTCCGEIRAIEQVRVRLGTGQTLKIIEDFRAQVRPGQFAQIAKMIGKKRPFTWFQRSLTIEGPGPLPAVAQSGGMEKFQELATHVELSRLARALDMRRRVAARQRASSISIGQGRST